MSKRSSPDSDDLGVGGGDRSDSSSPIAKRQRLVEFEPIRLPSVSGVRDIEGLTLSVQNYKLSERLVHKERLRNELQKRVEQLERRQTQDDAMLCIINRCWNRLDEDVRILLQRFDAETAVEGEAGNEYDATKSFLAQLSHWDNEEIDEKQTQRVEFSRRAISKLVQAFDRIMQRNEKLTSLMKGTEVNGSATPDVADGDAKSIEEEKDEKTKATKVEVDKAIAELNSQLQSENLRLQLLVTELQAKNHDFSLKHAAHEDEISAMETKTEEMRNQLEEVKYELEKTMRREDKLDYRLAEVAKKHQTAELLLLELQSKVAGGAVAEQDGTAKISKNKLEEMQANLDEQQDLAANRLAELQEMTDKNRAAQQQIETLKMNLHHLPADVITNSIEYRCLQSQFSVLYQESVKIRQQLEETRAQLCNMKTAHLKQIEQMESEELLAQQRLRQAMLELEDQLSQVRKEYEMLRLEFEQHLAANEQSGPVNREMRQLLASYKTQNQQLKQEVNRFKRKWKEAVSIVAKSQKELDQERKIRERSLLIELDDELASPDQEGAHKSDAAVEADDIEAGLEGLSPEEALKKQIERLKAQVADLRAQLDAFAELSSEERDRGEILSRERRFKSENEKLQAHVKKMASADRKEKTKFYSEETLKKMKHLEDQTEKLKKEAAGAKQEEDTLLNEMEVTGQAFEEMQEQNTRLLQQLKEKDDANLKLMSERIRSNQQQKKMKEEKDLVEELVGSLQNQVEAQNLVVRKLEEKERLLYQNLTSLENDLRMRQQALELNKRKALEYAQSAADLKLQLEKCTSQLTEAQLAVATKTSSLEVDSFKLRRLEEEKTVLKRKLDRAKKMEKADKVDEVLIEEIKELKDQLTCPSCKVHRKDAILTKCYHVFCMDCLKTRYETRRRKCPKCNAAFGANDYRRIYIG
uniref:E3 ubiquitin protein ligase n=3 Tax=Plectus sambesii TaxID=2011161 RepID=A0A914UKW1_9BILA